MRQAATAVVNSIDRSTENRAPIVVYLLMVLELGIPDYAGCRGQIPVCGSVSPLDATMPGCRAPIPSKGKQRFGALFSVERSIELTTAVNSNSEQTFSQLGHRKWNEIGPEVGLAAVVRCPPDELRGTAHSSRISCIMHHPLPATSSYKKYGFFEKVKASWIAKVVQRSRKVCKSPYSPDKL